MAATAAYFGQEVRRAGVSTAGRLSPTLTVAPSLPVAGCQSAQPTDFVMRMCQFDANGFMSIRVHGEFIQVPANFGPIYTFDYYATADFPPTGASRTFARGPCPFACLTPCHRREPCSEPDRQLRQAAVHWQRPQAH